MMYNNVINANVWCLKPSVAYSHYVEHSMCIIVILLYYNS